MACRVEHGNLCRAGRALRSMGVLLSHGAKHVNVDLEEATRGFPFCDTHTGFLTQDEVFLQDSEKNPEKTLKPLN